MAPLTVTLVRHGESTDNLIALWAGHRDAPLSNHGHNQALRLGASFKDLPITAIYASDLKRAHTTAKAIYDQNIVVGVKPPFVVSPLLREQYFGVAEGQPWDAGAFSSAHLPWDEHRSFVLAENAESLNDVGHRADIAVRHFVIPHLLASAAIEGGDGDGHHILIVAHGIFLAEFMFALKRGENALARFMKIGGYTNTGWSRVELELLDYTPPAEPDTLSPPPASETFTTPPSADGTPSPHAHLPSLALAPHISSLPPQLPTGKSVPPFKLKLLATNQTTHLDGLVRQKGGIGSAPHDERQKKMQDFFGGKNGDLEEWKGK